MTITIVNAGPPVANTVLNSGDVMSVVSGGTATTTTVNNGGSATVFFSGTTDSTTLLAGGVEVVSSGGLASATTVAGEQDVSSGGRAIDTVVSSGGYEKVFAGGLASGTALSGNSSGAAYQIVVASGSAVATTVYDGIQYDDGFTSLTVVSAGYETVENGGAAIDTTLVTGGRQTITGPSTATGTVVSTNSEEDVSSGGTASNTSVTTGGYQYVSSGGTAVGTVVSNGGIQTVLSLGSASNTTVDSGGNAYVSSGATVTSALLSGGTMEVFAGGVASDTIVSGGGEVMHGSGFFTSVRGGFEDVRAGGVASGTSVSGGTQFIEPGGSAVSAMLSGNCDQVVSSGAFAGGTVVSNGGYMDVQSSGAASGSVLSVGGYLYLESGGSAAATTVSSGGVEVVSSGGTASGTILAFGGAIDVPLSYTTGGSAGVDPTSDLLTVSVGGATYTQQLAGDYTGYSFTLTGDGGSGTVVTASCFQRGTRIATWHGRVPVEQLRIGDLLVTEGGGAEPVVWIGRRSYVAAHLPPHDRAALLPIRIAAGALDQGIPERDLYVSPEHMMCLEGVLVRAVDLLNGSSITRDFDADAVDYFHLELPRHSIIHAEGAATERLARYRQPQHLRQCAGLAGARPRAAGAAAAALPAHRHRRRRPRRHPRPPRPAAHPPAAPSDAGRARAGLRRRRRSRPGRAGTRIVAAGFSFWVWWQRRGRSGLSSRRQRVAARRATADDGTDVMMKKKTALDSPAWFDDTTPVDDPTDTPLTLAWLEQTRRVAATPAASAASTSPAGSSAPAATPAAPPDPPAAYDGPMGIDGPIGVDQVTSDDADIAMHANTARSTYGVDGTGLRIGIISDSFNNDGNEAAAQASGDLPTGSNMVVVQDYASGGTDEGKAMAELVHRAAPGAQIYFSTGYYDMATAITTLAADGCNVIVDDLYDSTDPFFQPGDAVSLAINQVVAEGVDYFTAAGNNGDDYYYSSWTSMPTGYSLPGVGVVPVLNVGNGTPFEQINLVGNGYGDLDLQWDQPFHGIGTYTGDTPYRIGVAVYNASMQFLYKMTTYNYVDTTQPLNVGGIYNESSSAQTYYLAFYESSGSVVPGTIKAVFLNTEYVEFTGVDAGTGSGSNWAHQVDPAANAVGAINYADTPAFGTTPPVNEPFSAYTGSQYLFDANGNRLTSPQPAAGPVFSAPDGSAVNAGTGFEGNAAFYGTSAAAPDAAAVSLLMLQEDSSLTTKQVTYILESTAVAASTTQQSGAGLVQADTAVAGASIAVGNPLWTGLGGDLLWSDAANWSNGAAPGAGALVVLGNGDGAVTAAYTSTFDLSSATVGTLCIDGSSAYDPVTPGLSIGAGQALTAATVLLGTCSPVTISGSLTVTGALGTGMQSVPQGAVATTGIVGSNGVTLESGARLSIGGTDADPIEFNGPSAQLIFSSSNSTVLTQGITGPISGFTAADTLDLTGLAFQTGDRITVNAGVATIFNVASPSVALASFTISGAFTQLGVQPDIGTGMLVTACFQRGTHIATWRGRVPVEQLRIGDLLVTEGGGAEPVVWIGRRSYLAAQLPAHDRAALLPIRIAAGALDQGIPERDLYVSPEHMMCLEGVLVRAVDLLNGSSITRDFDTDAVDYFHLELPRHSIIHAEGAATESWRDTGNRNIFANVLDWLALGHALQAPPQPPCRPIVTGGADLAAIRARLARRARCRRALAA